MLQTKYLRKFFSEMGYELEHNKVTPPLSFPRLKTKYLGNSLEVSILWKNIWKDFTLT